MTLKPTISLSLVALLLAGCMTQSSSIAAAQHKVPNSAAIDAVVEQLMSDEDVKGMAVAVIEQDEILHLNAYGFRNVEKGLPLEIETIMYGASLTKAAFAYFVLQLVDEGKLDLDTRIGAYLPKPLPEYEWWSSLEGDEQWERLTPRIILSHTTGLNNLRYFEPDQNLTFHFEPGTHYAYSGEGINILQSVIEEGLGLNVKDEMKRRLFEPFGMPNTSLQWREDFAENLADGYAIDGSFEPHDERSYVSASGSMDTTIADQARMWRAMLAGEGLSEEIRAAWIAGNFPIRTHQKFPSIPMHGTTTSRRDAISLSAGLGVETWMGPGGPQFAKGGHNDWTGNLVICQEVERRCIVMLANSVRAETIFPRVVELVLGETSYPWWWTYPSLHDRRRQ